MRVPQNMLKIWKRKMSYVKTIDWSMDWKIAEK